MAPSTQRIELLRADFRRFTRALQRLKGGDFQAVEPAWLATRRLREILPVLQLDGSAVRKVSGRLRKLNRRLAEARDLDGVLQVIDGMMASERRARSASARVQADLQKAAGQSRAKLTRKKSVHDARRAGGQARGAAPGRVPDRRSVQPWPRPALGGRRACRAPRGRTERCDRHGRLRLSGRTPAVGSRRPHQIPLCDRALRATGCRRKRRGHARVDPDPRAPRASLLHAGADRSRARSPEQARDAGLRVWRELDGVVVALESRSRALHARYVRERDAVVALCDRVTAKAPMASGSAGRRVG